MQQGSGAVCIPWSPSFPRILRSTGVPQDFGAFKMSTYEYLLHWTMLSLIQPLLEQRGEVLSSFFIIHSKQAHQMGELVWRLKMIFLDKHMEDGWAWLTEWRFPVQKEAPFCQHCSAKTLRPPAAHGSCSCRKAWLWLMKVSCPGQSHRDVSASPQPACTGSPMPSPAGCRRLSRSL